MNKRQQLIHGQLVADLKEAKAAADEKLSTPDIGTFNLDSVILHYGRYHVRYARAVDASGLRKRKSIWAGGSCILYSGDGDAMRNTVMVRAFADVLRKKGWPVYVSYLKD